MVHFVKCTTILVFLMHYLIFYVLEHVFNHFTKKIYEQRHNLHFNINNKIRITSMSIIINVHNMLQL